jgi:hypothetical protein
MSLTRRASRILIVPLLLLSGVAMARLLPPAEHLGAANARAILAEVMMNDVVYFRATTGDNGSPNVDEVWAYLPGLNFKPTQAFLDQLGEQPLGTTVALAGKKNQRSIELSISYGGRTWIRNLTLELDADVWRISADQVETNAPYRWIRRRAVDDLCEAKRKR